MNSGWNKYGSASLYIIPFFAYPYVLFLKNTKKLSQTCKRAKWLVQTERSSCSFWLNHISSSRSSSVFRNTITSDYKHWIACVGFSSFIAKIRVFWRYWAYEMIKKTWITPHKAFESFARMFLDGLELYLLWLPANAATVSGFVKKKSVYHGGTLEGRKNKKFIWKHPKVSN